MNALTKNERQAVTRRPLEGQRALVTGANSGIGEAVARGFADAGARVVVNYVAGEERAKEVVQDIERAGGEAIALRADVSKEAEVGAMFGQMIDAWGSIDILVNNAGLQKDAPLHQMSLRDWQFVIDVNLTGQFLCAREAVKEFLRRGVVPEFSSAAGKIICMSSVHDVIPWAGHANYAASKGGVSMLMKTMSQELAMHKIRVNSLNPGLVTFISSPSSLGEIPPTKTITSTSLMLSISFERIKYPDAVEL